MTLPAPRRTVPLLTILALLLPGGAVSAQEEPAKLVLASGAVSTGGEIEIEVRLDDADSRVSALTFVIDYDASKLALDAVNPRSRVMFDLPSGFVGHAFPFPDEGRLGIAIYDPDAPLSVIADGLLARIRFSVLPEAQGTAAFAIEPSASAADADATLVPLVVPVDPVGVTLPGTSAAPRRIRPAAPASGTASSGTSEGWRWAVPLTALAGDSGWRTRLEITNRSKESSVIELMTAGTGATVRERFALAAGDSRVIEDLGALFIRDARVHTAIILTSTSPDLGISATMQRAETDLPVLLPAVKWEDLDGGADAVLKIARELRMSGSSHLAIVNVGEESAVVRIAARDGHGEVIHREVMSVGAGMSAAVDLGKLGASVERNLLVLEMISTGSRVLGYLVQQDRILNRPLIRTAH